MSRSDDKLRRALSWRFDKAQMMRDAGFEPGPHQVELLQCTERNILVLWPRQSGKSQTCAADVLHTAAFDPGDIVILAGEKQEQAMEVFTKAQRMHEQLSELGELPSAERSGNKLTFSNGSRVLALPSTVDSIRGYAAKLVVIDEAAFTGDDVLAKVSPMLSTTRGRLVCPSTPNGAIGWFHDRWQNPEGWARLTVAASQLTRIDAAELARQRNTLGDFKFRQEYGLEFLDQTTQYFQTEMIQEALADLGGPLW